MKKWFASSVALFLTISLAACGPRIEPDKAQRAEDYDVTAAVEADQEYCAFIRSLGTDTIEVDLAEYITDEDTERMEELGLTADDMPDGYYIYNPDRETAVFRLTKETNYTFIHWGHDFVDTDEFEDLFITTTSRELFRSYLNTYSDSEPGMPFFMEIRDGEVKRIVEKPMM